MVAIDETYAWSEDIVAKAGKIQQVYLYDERVVTFMCEMTPSYRLIPLYFLTEHRVDDDTHEVMMAQPSEETYIHVRSVDAMKTIRCVARSITAPKYNSRAMLDGCSMST